MHRAGRPWVVGARAEPASPSPPPAARAVETRSHAWYSLGLGDELAPRFSRKALAGLLAALVVLAGTLIVYDERRQIAPGYGQWIRVATVAILIVAGTAAAHWLARGLSPRLYRRLDPATAGTLGFVIRLGTLAAVAILALRIAGVTASTLAVGGAFTAVLLGLAAQQALSGVLPASSCRARGRSGSANGCGWSAACWPARWRARSPPSASSTRR